MNRLEPTLTRQGLKKQWVALRPRIEKRLAEFDRLWKTGDDKTLFAELAFCLFTPQSKAHSCWLTVQYLISKRILFSGKPSQFHKELNRVRFKYNKTAYVLAARSLFFGGRIESLKNHLSSFKNDFEAREWLVQNIKGMGYKEATHFLRNIGRAKYLAILDRHILRKLKSLGVIKEMPDSLNRTKYLQIEEKMRKFSKQTKIPMDHLDFVLWYEATGDIFK